MIVSNIKKYYSAIFCLLEAAFKIQLAQNSCLLTLNGHDASAVSHQACKRARQTVVEVLSYQITQLMEMMLLSK